VSFPFASHADVIGESDDRDLWLALRRAGIGASDVASILGCGFSTLAELWAEKTGRADGEDLSGVERIAWGNRLEPVIISAYAEPCYAGRPVERSGKLLRSRVHPWALATLDAWTVHPVHGRIPLEVKKWSAFAAEAWADGAPEPYQIQVHAQMLVTGAPCASIACLIGGDRLVWCDVERDESMIARIVLECQRFWRHVECDEMPPPDGTPEWARVFRDVRPEEPGLVADLGDDARAWAAKLEEAQAAEKAAKAAASLAKNQLVSLLGSAPEGRFADGSGFTYRAQTRAAHTVAESTFHVLRSSAAPKPRKRSAA
jgi:putative phage-type endonuclease